jgi:UDP-N-acetylglucosamine pyrophosphorylase
MNSRVYRNFGRIHINNVLRTLSLNLFSIFNTNNLWIDLSAMKRVIEDRTLHMEIIVNHKVRDYSI